MRPSLGCLLADSLDYAGMFPPAELPLETALRNYLDYQRREHSWFLGRFVCPAKGLSELAGLLLLLPPDSRLRLSVLGQSQQPSADWFAALEADLAAMKRLCAEHGERVRVDYYEAPLPRDALALDPVALTVLLNRVRERFEAAGMSRLSVFLETRRWWELLQAIGEAAQLFSNEGDEGIRFGWKIRAGGSEPCDFPAASAVAHLIAGCRDARLPWKATAGLHEPLRAIDRQLNVFRFGFLSLIAAAVLAQVHNLTAAQIQPILEETHADRFRFSDSGFSWQTITANRDQIAAARDRSMVSFGSCSFAEPIEGLERLKLLEGVAGHD